MPRRPPSDPSPAQATPRAARVRRSVGAAAVRKPGQGSDTTPSSDWLAEREHRASPTENARAAGVPVDTGPTGPVDAIESRRSAHKSG